VEIKETDKRSHHRVRHERDEIESGNLVRRRRTGYSGRMTRRFLIERFLIY